MRKYNDYRFFIPVLAFIASFLSQSAFADPVRHTDWCFEPQTNNRLIDQPMDQGNCSALLAAGAAASYFSGNGQLADLLLNSRQNEWAVAAAELACTPGPMNDQFAIRLIQACQCHNSGAQSEIENNQTQVLQTLRAHCRSIRR